MEIAFPFTIFTDTEAGMHLSHNKPLIHLDTLAQICFRAFSQTPDLPRPELAILDPKAVDGVSQPGRFEIDFNHNYIKKVGEISSDLKAEKKFRLGLLHEKTASKVQEEQLIESYQNAILLHGELNVFPQKKEIDSKETTIQWITA